MASKKKKIRNNFRNSVFKRDRYKCVLCGLQSTKELAHTVLDAHHITPREDMPNGGYVKENGISLCDPSKLGGSFSEGCHFKAESVLKNRDLIHDPSYHNYSPQQLYLHIGSSYEEAVEHSHSIG